jgi:hypothetical protein
VEGRTTSDWSVLVFVPLLLLPAGVATVVGRVGSVEERAEVLAAVRDVVGARKVEDQLILWPGA